MEGNRADSIILKNNQVIAFNKPCGILVQSDQSDDKSLLQLAEIYCKHPLGLIHRLDRPASGVCIFAKSKEALVHINKQMQNREVEKVYWAVVPKGEIEQKGTLTHYLRRNGKIKKSEISLFEKPGFKKAELTYKVISTIDNYQLLEVQLITGRFHQIRAQLSAMGFPIKGDVKYGARRGNKNRSIHLHARSITFKHPTSREKLYITADVPEDVIWKAFNY
jgi:23S rRNA pseudouridine1911/1915/1917 synthase